MFLPDKVSAIEVNSLNIQVPSNERGQVPNRSSRTGILGANSLHLVINQGRSWLLERRCAPKYRPNGCHLLVKYQTWRNCGWYQLVHAWSRRCTSVSSRCRLCCTKSNSRSYKCVHCKELALASSGIEEMESENNYLRKLSRGGLLIPTTDMRHYIAKSFAILDLCQHLTRDAHLPERTAAEVCLLRNDFPVTFLCEELSNLVKFLNRTVSNVFFNNARKQIQDMRRKDGVRKFKERQTKKQKTEWKTEYVSRTFGFCWKYFVKWYWYDILNKRVRWYFSYMIVGYSQSLQLKKEKWFQLHTSSVYCLYFNSPHFTLLTFNSPGNFLVPSFPWFSN